MTAACLCRPFRATAFVAIALAASACTSPSGSLALQPGLKAAEHRRDTEAVGLLSAYLSQDNLPAADAEQAIGTLITIHLAHGEYEKAARAWEALDPDLREKVSDDTRQTALIVVALRNAPPPRVDKSAAPVPTRRDQANLIRANGQFGSASSEAVIDTGANLSVVTESFASRAGYRVLPVGIAAGASTGAKVMANLAVGDIRLGDTIFHDAAILVVADSDLAPSPDYRIEAILGFPQLAAAGRVQFSPDHIVLGAPATGGRAAPIEMRGLDIYVDAEVEKSTLRLHLDTGARRTTFGPRAAEALAERLRNARFEAAQVGGAGGMVKTELATLPDLPIRVGDAAAPIEARYSRDASQLNVAEDSDGRLGQDFYGQFVSYTIDFDAMTIRFEPKP